LEEAEYAATHRGQTNWANEHPLTDIDDLIHSIIHRLEGSNVGEGGYTGFENAKYWAMGGPKMYSELISTTSKWKEIYQQQLCLLAKRYAPTCVSKGLIVNDSKGRVHEIIAGGGKYRNVHVPYGCWDALCFIDLMERASCKQDEDCQALEQELSLLHKRELELLLASEN